MAVRYIPSNKADDNKRVAVADRLDLGDAHWYSAGRREIVLMDSAVPDYQALVDGMAPGSEVVLLDADHDGIEQITEALIGRRDVDAIHVVSHGGAGRLELGNAMLDASTLAGYAGALGHWGEALGPEGDILLYGCEVAAGDEGKAFVSALARMTGANVAASDDKTGAAELGGDWELEWHVGQVTSPVFVGRQQQNQWQGLLAASSEFDWDNPAAADNGMSVSQTVSGVTLTISASNGTDMGLGATDMWNMEALAAFADTGYTNPGTVYTFDFNQPVDLGTLELLTTSGDTTATFHASGYPDVASGPIANLSNASVVDLSSFTGITSFTMTPAAAEQFYFDQITFTAANAVPEITGSTSGQAVDDIATLIPFSGVTVADSDGDAVSVTVALDAQAKGAFTAASLAASGFTDNGNGTYSLATGAAATATTALRQLVFDPAENRVASGATETTTFTITVNDGSTDGTDSSTTVISTSINDAPTLVPGGPVLNTITEDDTTNAGQTVSSFLASTVSDVDSGALEGIAMTGLSAGDGTWQYSTDGGSTWSDVGSVSDGSALLLGASDKVRFVPGSQDADSASFTYRAWDQTSGTSGTRVDTATNGGGTAYSSTTDTATLSIGAVNDAPTASNLPGDISVTEETASNVDLSSLAIDDVDGDSLTATLTASGGTFTASTGGGVAITGSGTGTLKLSGTAGDINTYLDTVSNIQYTGAANASGDNAASLTLNVDDGTVNPQLGSANIDIANINDAPTVSNLPAGIAINEDQPGNLDISASSFADPDSASISITLTVSAGTIGLANPSGSLDGTTGNGTSSVVLTGSTTNINAYLDTPSNVVYTPDSDVNGVGAATLSLSVNDNDGSGNVSMGSVPINITAVNDAPSVSGVFGDTSSQVTAGSGALNVTGLDDAILSNIDSSDYNGGALTLTQNTGMTNGSWGLDGTIATAGGDGAIAPGETVSIGGTAIGTVDASDDGQSGNTLTIALGANATNAAVQQLVRALTYDAPSGLGDRSFTLALNDADGTADGGDETASGSFTLSVTPNPPVLGGLDGDSVTFTEGTAPVRLDMGGNATVTDLDSADFNGGALTVTIADGGDAADDVLSLSTAGNVSLAGATAGSTVSVGGTAIGTLANNIAAGNDLVVHLDTNATPARVQELMRALTYSNTDTATPDTTSRSVTVTLNDGSGAVSTASTVTVAVEAVNDAPVLSGVDATPGFTEGGVAVVLDADATIADPELDAANGGVGDYAGASLTLARKGGANADDGFSATGTLGALTEGGNLDVGGTTIGTVTANSSGTLTLTFNANATSARVNSALQQIAYVNNSDAPPASVEIGYRFNDGNSGVQGSGGALADADDSVTVTLTGVNDAPVFTTATALNVAENATAVTTLAATDAEGDALVYSITGGADAALFSLNANSGALTFTGAPDFETPQDQDTDNIYEVTVAAADGTDQTAHALAVTVTDVDETPPNPDPDPTPSPIQISEPVSRPDMPSGLPSVSETITNTGNTPGSAKLVENTGNANEVTATLPGGVSLVNQGARSAVDARQSLADLIASIDAKQPGNLTDQTGVASQWIASRPGGTMLDIRTLVLDDSGSASTSTPIRITGIADDTASDHQEAFVIDAGALPGGNRIQLDNIDFASIIGATTLSGGAGANVVIADDAAQTIVLGADDDELHGGGGRDLVGSHGGDDLIHGDAGYDRLFGGEGDDTLDGGSGVDVARFALDAGEAMLRHADDGSLIVNAGSLGSDTLKGIELLRFDDRVVLAEAPALVESSGFDEAFYLADNPDVAAAVARGDIPSGEWHYQHYGADEGRLGDPAELDFDRALYLAANPDVAAAVAAGDIDAFAHYRDYGAAEGRTPNALFDERGYREANPDVDAAIQRGELDSGYQHYQAWGWQEGRDPSAWFDLSEYLEANPDIAEAGVEPLGHYLRYGYDEGRVITPADDGLWG